MRPRQERNTILEVAGRPPGPWMAACLPFGAVRQASGHPWIVKPASRPQDDLLSRPSLMISQLAFDLSLT